MLPLDDAIFLKKIHFYGTNQVGQLINNFDNISSTTRGHMKDLFYINKRTWSPSGFQIFLLRLVFKTSRTACACPSRPFHQCYGQNGGTIMRRAYIVNTVNWECLQYYIHIYTKVRPADHKHITSSIPHNTIHLLTFSENQHDQKSCLLKLFTGRKSLLKF